MIRGLIFDLDGTLVDSLPGIADALNHSLEDVGLPTFPRETVKSFVGDGVEMLVKRALGETNALYFEQVLNGFQQHYPEDWKSGTHPYPGMMELLEVFHEKGIPMAVLSNKPHLYTREIVETLFPKHLFDPVLGHQKAFPKKPDPSTALTIAEKWGFSVNEVAYVGDSTVDLATAINGGFVPLIFSWGYGTPENIPLLHSINELHQAALEDSSNHTR